MRAMSVLLATLGMAAQLSGQSVTPTPTPTPTVAATTGAHPLKLGFGTTAVARPTPPSSKVNPARSDSLAAIASRIKVRKLTADELKSIHSADDSARAVPDTAPVSGALASDEQRAAALQEFEETFKPLRQRALQVEAERRACDSACAGTTSGSAFTTDTNGNWVVINTSVVNSTTPQCRQCRVKWLADADQVVIEFAKARDKAHQQGVFEYELDSHRLVFGNASK